MIVLNMKKITSKKYQIYYITLYLYLNKAIVAIYKVQKNKNDL